MITLKTTAEIILETLQYYGQDPMGKRGMKTKTYQVLNQETGNRDTRTSTSCEYVVTNGEEKYCAIGRCLTDDAKEWAKSHSGGVGEIISEWWSAMWAQDEFDNFNDNPELEYFPGNKDQDPEEDSMVYFDDMLQPVYVGQEQEFWEQLQELHDNTVNWDGGGSIWLTEDGYNHVAQMVDNFIADPVERDAFMADLQAHTEDFNYDTQGAP